MIDPDEFENGMAILASAFGKVIDVPLTRAYYGVLGKALTTPEFTQAVARVMASERFWPSPAVLLESVGKRPTNTLAESAMRLEAGAAFDALRGIAEKTIHGPSWRAEVIDRQLGAKALAAFRAIGGQTRLREATTENEHWARREFITAYDDAARVEAAGLPLPTPDDVRRIGPRRDELGRPTTPQSVRALLNGSPLTVLP